MYWKVRVGSRVLFVFDFCLIVIKQVIQHILGIIALTIAAHVVVGQVR